MQFEKFLPAAIKYAVDYAKSYSTHSDPTLNVAGLDDGERVWIKQNQTCITAPLTEMVIECGEIFTVIFEKLKITPAEGRRGYNINLAGAVGVNEDLKSNWVEGTLPPEIMSYKLAVEGHVFAISLDEIVKKLPRYDSADDAHSFPLVRGQAAGIMEGAKFLARCVGFDLVANDAHDPAQELLPLIDKDYSELAKIQDHVLIARATTPDEAWAVAKTLDNPTYTEVNVGESSRRFAVAFQTYAGIAQNVVLLDARDKVIFSKKDGVVMRYDYNAVGAWKKDNRVAMAAVRASEPSPRTL